MIGLRGPRWRCVQEQGERRYEVQAILGTGGFGTVYRARYVGEGGFVKQVAIKILNDKMHGVEEMARRLRDEARMLGMLEHRAIVRVDQLVQFDHRWAVIMEYINGVDLSVLLGRGPLPVHYALDIVAEVAGALHAAYDSTGEAAEPLRLVHRDIKPENIFLTAGGSVKVLDFGIARAEFDEREAVTQGSGYGSPRYMAPERFDLSSEANDESSIDIYSLGVVLYELCLGQIFGRTSPIQSRHELLVQERLERVVQAGLPDEVVEMISHMLAYRPMDRLRASEVERKALFLRSKIDGGLLRFWAQEVVPPLIRPGDALPQGMTDVLVDHRGVGTGFQSSETIAFESGVHKSVTPVRSGLGKLGWGTLALLFAGVAGIAGGSAFYYLADPSPTPAPEAFAPSTPLPAPVPHEPDPVEEPAVEEPEVDEPADEEPADEDPVPSLPGPTREPAVDQLTEVAEDEPHGVVDVVGDADRVVLVGARNRYGVPGRVPPGKYSIAAAFSGRSLKASGAIEVLEGAALAIRCDGLLETCLTHY